MAHLTSRMYVIVAALVEWIREWSGHAADEQLLRAISGVAWVVRAFEHAADACEERGDGIMCVLVAGVPWEHEFGDRSLHVVTCGGTSSERSVGHGDTVDTEIAEYQARDSK